MAAPSHSPRMRTVQAAAAAQASQQELTPIAVTVKQAARLLGTNDKQIRRGIYAREIPVVRFGNSYSVGVDDLRAWFNRKKATL